jgi:hypothetical protein
MPPVAKAITRFLPLADRPVAESEAFYRSEHVPLARELLARHPGIVAYDTIRTTAELGADGRWHPPVSAWRFITQRLGDAPVSRDGFRPEHMERLTKDHLSCLRQLRRCEVDERVAFDRLTGQTALATYLIELDRGDEADRSTAEAQADQLIETLTDAADRTGGIRRITTNTVLRETRAAPIEADGQALTDEYLAETEKHSYIEVVADDAFWGAGMFAERTVTAALSRLTAFQLAAVYETEERCGFDKRPLSWARPI